MHSIRIACRRWYNINPHLCQRSLSSASVSSCQSQTTSTSSSLHYDRDTGIIWEKTLSLSDIQKKPIYQTIIGIEIHAQLSIPTKLFSSAPTRHHSDTNNNNNTSSALPNTNVHPYDIAYPGTLPSSPSIQAIQSSILASAALNCNINTVSRFERKHYFYPDLPTGYQITQQRWPLASDGMIKFMPTSSSSSNVDSNDQKKGKKKKRRRGGSSNDDDDVNVDQKQMQDNKSSSTTNIIEPVELRIERIQLEQDTGKTTTHTIRNGDDKNTKITKSYIDYNRAGSALIEIVSHPDLRSAHEASGAVEHIRKLLKHVGSCDGRMEEGSLRCDLNVSIAPILDDESEDTTNSSIYNRHKLPVDTGERVEVKNLNSLRQIIAATEYEALRQSTLAQNSTLTGRETRTWNVKPTSETHPLGGETFCIRAKGDAIDYRFMPEPDLPPLVLDGEKLGCGSDKKLSLDEYIDMHMPESAEDAKSRLVDEYGLTEDVAAVITGDPPAIALFGLTVETAKSELESTRSEDIDKADMKKLSTLAANWLCNDLFALVKKSAVKDIDEGSEGGLNHPISVEYSTVDGQRLGALIAMLANNLLTTPMAKKVLNIMYEEEDSHSHPKDIAKVNGWEVISDMEALIQLCESVVLDSTNASQLEQYKLGGKKVWKIEKFFVGKIMGVSKGNAHPERMKEALSIVLSQ